MHCKKTHMYVLQYVYLVQNVRWTEHLHLMKDDPGSALFSTS